jgi:single-stranded DNA-binding protein
MDTHLNQVVLTGTVERPPLMKVADHGTQVCSFTLRCVEPGPAGKEFVLYVPCEAYSSMADEAGELNAGDAALVSGKLKFTSWTAKDGTKKTSLAVLARQVRRLLPAAISAAVG